MRTHRNSLLIHASSGECHIEFPARSDGLFFWVLRQTDLLPFMFHVEQSCVITTFVFVSRETYCIRTRLSVNSPSISTGGFVGADNRYLNPKRRRGKAHHRRKSGSFSGRSGEANARNRL